MPVPLHPEPVPGSGLDHSWQLRNDLPGEPYLERFAMGRPAGPCRIVVRRDEWDTTSRPAHRTILEAVITPHITPQHPG